MKKKILGLILAISVILSCIPIVSGSEIVDSGEYYDVKWQLDSDGVLTLSGNGGILSKTVFGQYKDNVKALDIQNGITSIGSELFLDYTNLERITIADSVTSIGKDAFKGSAYYNNDSNWENNVLYIDNYLIKAKDDITSVQIKDGTTTIASNAFAGCVNLADISIPDSMIYFSRSTFADSAYYADENNWENGMLYNGTFLLAANTDITTAEIKSGTKIAASRTFDSCRNLVSAVLPESLTNIPEAMFSGCSVLESVNIPQSIEIINRYAFSYCYKLQEIVIPEKVRIIDDVAFGWCKTLTEVIIPDSVTYIGGDAFCACEALTKVHLGKNVETIDRGAFVNCFALKEVNIPEKIWLIDINAFSGCAIENLVIPDNVLGININAFGYCENLTEVVIPDSVRAIGSEAFTHCKKLKKVTMGKNVSLMQYGIFSDCTSLEEIEIPSGINTINRSMFYNCTSLKKVFIPKSIQSIGTYVFYNCKSLTDIYYTGTEEEWNAIEIDNDNKSLENAVIHYNYDPTQSTPSPSPSVSPSPTPSTSPNPTPTPSVSPSPSPTVPPVPAISKTDTGFTVQPDAKYENCTAYAAVYDESGRLLRVSFAQLKTDSATDIALDFDGGAYAKVFIWTDTFEPVLQTPEPFEL